MSLVFLLNFTYLCLCFDVVFYQARYSVLETCLALTIFREELNLKVLALFTTLLFVKTFHWLAQLRVDNV